MPAPTTFDMNMQIADLGALTTATDEGEIRGVVETLVSTLAPVVIEAIVDAFRDRNLGSANTTRALPDQAAVDQLTQDGVRFSIGISTPIFSVGFST